MKVDVKMLNKFIREVVQDEMRKVLPEIVKEHLTETYLRKLTESVTKRDHIKESFTDDPVEVDEIPEPLRNSNKGIYQKSPLVKNNESIAKLLSKDLNPLADLYEGVKPIPPEHTADAGSIRGEGVPLDALGVDPNVMKQLAGISTKKKAPVDDVQMRRIKEMRDRLNSQVVGNNEES